MKKKYNEKNKLPLTYQYLDIFKTKYSAKLDSNSLYFLKSEKYQTDHHVLEKPLKPLVRLL